jgi:hypothetical protein
MKNATAFKNNPKKPETPEPSVNMMTEYNLSTIKQLPSTQENSSVCGWTLPSIPMHQRRDADTFEGYASD